MYDVFIKDIPCIYEYTYNAILIAKFAKGEKSNLVRYMYIYIDMRHVNKYVQTFACKYV